MGYGLFEIKEVGDDLYELHLNESAEISERPTAKPWDGEYGPSLNLGGKEIDADTYNAALDNLKKSFKEGYEIADMLSNANIVKTEDVFKAENIFDAEIDEGGL